MKFVDGSIQNQVSKCTDHTTHNRKSCWRNVDWPFINKRKFSWRTADHADYTITTNKKFSRGSVLTDLLSRALGQTTVVDALCGRVLILGHCAKLALPLLVLSAPFV